MYKNEELYPLANLAQILKTSPEDLAEFAEKVQFTAITKVNSLDFIKKDDIERFFEEYVLHSNITPRYWKILPHLDNSVLPWATTLVKMYQEKFAYPTCVSPSQGQLLKELVSNINPQNILEIGCFIGISTIWMAAGLEEIESKAIIHSVDLFEPILLWTGYNYGYLNNPLEYAKNAALSAQLSHRISFYKMSSEELGKKFSQFIDRPIDFLYIDGDHSVPGCVNDFVLFYPQVPIGGYIMLHDIYPKFCGYEGPRYIIDNFIKKSPHFDLVEINTTPHNFGIALIRKRSEDKNLYPGKNWRLELHRARIRLSKTTTWKKIKDKPMGNLVRKVIRRI